MTRGRKIALAAAVFLVGSILLALLLLAPDRRNPAVLAKLHLPDGRIIQVEAISYGTEHRVGPNSVLLDLIPWMPRMLTRWFEPKRPQSALHEDEPALVVWVNAIDATTGTNVDCQGLRLEFVDSKGDLFGEENSSWFGGDKFWRVGHTFRAFPRDEKTLTLRISTVMRKFANLTNASGEVRLPNPVPAAAAQWAGRNLPQTQTIGDLEFALTSLRLRTNGSPARPWETAAVYWEPVSEFRRDGRPVGGWREPEWTAEDPLGNHGKFLGIHQPVLRYQFTVYPLETNTQVAIPIASLPAFSIPNLTSNLFWNQEATIESNTVLAIGCLPAGTHPFTDGHYATNPPGFARMGPVGGGAPSGWVGVGRRNALGKVEHFDGHYSPSPVIYLRTTLLGSTNRIGVRLRDDQGRYWAAKPEPQGYRQWIMPYLLELPADVTNVVPEIVLLKPATATFTVKTGGQPIP